MPKTNIHKGTSRRHTMAVQRASQELAVYRQGLDGTSWEGRREELVAFLAQPVALAVTIEGQSRRMDKDGRSMRAACMAISASYQPALEAPLVANLNGEGL